MRIVRRLSLALALASHLLSAHAQVDVTLNGSTLWTSGDKLYIQGIGVSGQGNFDAGFQWDGATTSFRLMPDSVTTTTLNGTVYCPSMRFIDMAADGATRLVVSADLMVDSWSRNIQLTLTYQSPNDATTAGGSFTFRPARLRLIQDGHIYTVADVSSTANPHFVPGNGWLPNLEPLSQNNYSTAAAIVDFPAGFDLTRAFYVYYGGGTPAAPAADGNDTYYYCTAY